MPIYVPRELIHAAGMLPVGIVGGGDRLEIIRGDAYFQSYICHIPRSTIELALSRAPRRARRHAVPVDLRRDPQPVRHVADALSRHATSATSTCRRTSIARSAATSGGTSSTATARGLRAHRRPHRSRTTTSARSIAVYNENRARDPRALPRRAAERRGVSRSREVYLVLRAGNVLPPGGAHRAAARATCDRRAAGADAASRITAASCWPACSASSRRSACSSRSSAPAAGSSTTTCCSACAGSQRDVPHRRRSARQPRRTPILASSVRTASRYAPDGHRGQWLVDPCARNGAEGVIFCAPSFCDPALLEQPMLVAGARARRHSPHRSSSTPRTPASSRSSASRPARSPIRSGCGARHERDTHDTSRAERAEHAAAEGDDRRITTTRLARAPEERARRSSTPSCPAT